jgi:dihydropteroate synthase
MNNVLPVSRTISSKGRILDLSQPVVMGILNVTPNSFYNRGRDSDLDSLLKNADKMVLHGAKILDIGGASSKPGEPISNSSEEIDRIAPVIEAIHKLFPDVWISSDTYHSAVAIAAVAAGASIINDISAGDIDKNMIHTVAKLKVPFIAMHIQGIPETMQISPQYKNAPFEILNYLKEKLQQCYLSGITDVIIDPGFGFGKTIQHNFEMLQVLHSLRILGVPMLTGLSRKSMITKTLKITAEEALNGTSALHMIALKQGANILRVHDVREAQQVIDLYNEVVNTPAY